MKKKHQTPENYDKRMKDPEEIKDDDALSKILHCYGKWRRELLSRLYKQALVIDDPAKGYSIASTIEQNLLRNKGEAEHLKFQH